MAILIFGTSTRRLVKGRGHALECNVTRGCLFLKRLLLSQLILALRVFFLIFFFERRGWGEQRGLLSIDNALSW